MLYKVKDNYITSDIFDNYNDLKRNIKIYNFFNRIYL